MFQILVIPVAPSLFYCAFKYYYQSTVEGIEDRSQYRCFATLLVARIIRVLHGPIGWI